MPELYIITGSNGAGKSTVGSSYLPAIFQETDKVFDGDKFLLLKQKELWDSGIRAHKESKKIAREALQNTFDRLVIEAIENNASFAYEGHFTNDATWEIPKMFKERGYIINLIFFGLDNLRLSEMRVLDRVNNDKGHSVPIKTIEDNFYGNLEKLNIHFSFIDNLTIVDTSEINHITIAIFKNGIISYSIPFNELPEWFSKYLPNLTKQIPK